MGNVCSWCCSLCSRHDSIPARPAVPAPTPAAPAFTATAARHQFTPMQIDVLMPKTPGRPSVARPAPPARPSGTSPDPNPDETVYSMCDINLSLEASRVNNATVTTLNTATNMSFTNDYKVVDEDAVNTYLQSVQQLIEADDSNALLEDNLLKQVTGDTHGAAFHRLLAERAGGGGGAARAGMTAEQLEYIEQGGPESEKMQRLGQVEYATRQNIVAAWALTDRLIELAAMRIVPTLRMRRQRDEEDGKKHGLVRHRKRRARRPVLVVHAGDLTLDNTSLPTTPMDRSLLVTHSGETAGRSTVSAEAQANPTAAAAATTTATDEAATHAAAGAGGANAKTMVVAPAEAAAAPRPGLAAPPPPQTAPTAAAVAGGRDEAGTAPAVEHLELLALSCQSIAVNGRVEAMVVSNTWDFLSIEACVEALNRGDCVFRLLCAPTNDVDEPTIELIDTIINLSAFADETQENNTPIVHIRDPLERATYIAVLVKTMYMLPGVQLSDITPQLIASDGYQKACQPSSNKIEYTGLSDTFRLSVTIIKFVYSLKIQFKVSEITDPLTLQALRSIDGIVPGKALLLERTKRDISKTDATVKVRSVLLYYPVNGGVLVNSQTIVLNSSLPTIVSKIVNTFGSMGASQSIETAKLARRFFAQYHGGMMY